MRKHPQNTEDFLEIKFVLWFLFPTKLLCMILKLVIYHLNLFIFTVCKQNGVRTPSLHDLGVDW
jgi:hypothetical protein